MIKFVETVLQVGDQFRILGSYDFEDKTATVMDVIREGHLKETEEMTRERLKLFPEKM